MVSDLATLNTLAKNYNDRGAFAEAILVCQEMLQLAPGAPAVSQNLGKICSEMGRLPEALNYYYRARDLAPNNPSIWSDLLLTLNYTFASPETVFLEHSQYHRVFGAQFSGPKPRPVLLKNRPLNLGYVSADFREHPVAHLIMPILRHHNREKFKIFLYSSVADPDDITRQIKKQAGVWRDISSQADSGAASLIRRDQIDILVDLGGHTGSNRLPIFARRPAPVQVSWLGYMNTTGLPQIDYRLTDNFLAPPGLDRFYTERLWRLPAPAGLPDSFTFEPLMFLPDVALLPALKNGYITLASLNNFKKINDRVLDLWVSILKAVPNARFLLSAKGDATFHREIATRLAGRGLDPDRLQIIGVRALPDFLKLFDEIDLLLDPFPFSGCLTVYHGLYGGVPSIVLQGQTEYSRNGAAVMRKANLPDFIAESKEDYVRLALHWAQPVNWSKLAAIRAGMRDCFPPNEAAIVTKSVESAFLEIREK